MDPDGLSILTAVLSGTACLALSYGAGTVCADDTQKDRRTLLGFSDRMAGLSAALVFACAFFVYGMLRLYAPQPAWVLLWLAGMAAAMLLCGALGLVKGGAPWAAAASPVGTVFAFPAKLLFRAASLSAASDVTEEDLLSLVDDVEEQDLIDETQKEMINNIFELDDVTAGDIMTHRTELITLPETASVNEAVALVQQNGFSRIPVYRKNIDDIAGILYAKDLFALCNTPDGVRAVSEFMRSAMFVPEACRARELLVDFKVKHTQIAVVVDEYGGTAGIVSMEDVLEEIVGNIQDEFDDEEEDLVRTEDGLIAVGSADLEDVFDALGLPVPEEEDEEDFDSVSGLVIDRLGRIPAAGEAVQVCYGGVCFTVLEVDERRIAKVKCVPQTPAKQDGTEKEE